MAAVNQFDYRTGVGDTHPASHAELITPSDTVDLTNVSRAVYVGGAGHINAIFLGGETVLLSNVPAGTLLPIRVSRIKSTSTTATLLIGLS